MSIQLVIWTPDNVVLLMLFPISSYLREWEVILILTLLSKNGEKIGAILIGVPKNLSSTLEELWLKNRRIS